MNDTQTTDTQPHADAKAPSQFRLLGQRRFGPFFATQLAGAFNDSFLKQLTILLVTFHAAEFTTLSAGVVANIVAGLFILPFVLFSAYAGQLADRYDKARVIRTIKTVEILIMGVASAGFYLQSLPLLLAAIFAMGCHSAFFGPVKYSLLPRVLAKQELTGGNGLLETGTFLSILLGTLAAGVLAAATLKPIWLSLALLGFALCGLGASLFIPATGEAAPDLQPRLRILSETVASVRMGRREGTGVWNSLLAISWFWFIGSVVLAQLPSLGKDLLHGDTTVVTVLLATFSVGIAAGSLLCERLSGHSVEIGLVPIGSIGLSLFTADLAWSAGHFADGAGAAVLDASAFLAADGSLRILADILLLGLFGGLFIVPLYAFIQLRTAPERQSRIIGANNILNALFMVVAAGMSVGLLAAGVSITGLIWICAGLNALVAVYIYKTVPEFLWRFVSWIVVHTAYRMKVAGRPHIPEQGAAMLAPNHVAFTDALLLSALCPRPIRFVMDAGLFRMPLMSWLFRQVGTIPIAPAKKEPETLAKAMAAVDAALHNGELVCIFPEGALTRDGKLAEFKPGISRMLQACPVPVIPVGMAGQWETPFTRSGLPVVKRLTTLRPGRKLVIHVGAPLPPDVPVDTLRSHVQALVEAGYADLAGAQAGKKA